MRLNWCEGVTLTSAPVRLAVLLENSSLALMDTVQ